ncbi:hypothetical protein SAMD00019534_020010 [Acytostelium subglobosum LB1]|uniref:hypothetical protein n=1 Tax=Acytostelium subglobosum LB1 TaxID=1410327 RepID=UPI0006448BC6|nr:hypothetical protein SAMD00019534_020010 [Acytostelium subglobosum LB1]GAM18826.1 hypothetical protein SAMD00019534_020010 [Acytostelium subglobosum LB1]|eukprot:XP_012758046.1 hypothetical protein SAMD00019534_020010 [Acytostelium subglobosum LB1]
MIRQAFETSKIDMIKYLLRLIVTTTSLLIERPDDVAEIVYRTQSSQLIRELIDPTFISKDMADLVRYHAHNYVTNILLTGDGLLVDELLPLPHDGVSNYRITGTRLIQSIANSTANQHYEQIQRLVKYNLIAPNTFPNTLFEHAYKESKEQCQSLMSFVGSDEPATISEEQRLLITKLLYGWTLYFYFQPSHVRDVINGYISTGDCTLIPLLIDQFRNEKIINHSIIEYGTLTQIKIAYLYMDRHHIAERSRYFAGGYHSQLFMTASNSANKLKIIKYLNELNHVFEVSTSDIQSFDGTMEMLEFLVSNTNKILPFKQFFILDHRDNLNLVIENKPKLIHFQTQLCLAIKIGKLDAVQRLVQLFEPAPDSLPIQLTYSARLRLPMFQWLIEYCASSHYARNSLRMLMEWAIKNGNLEAIKFLFANYAVVVDWQIQAIKAEVSAEMMDTLFCLNQWKIDWRAFNELNGACQLSKVIRTIFERPGNTTMLDRVLRNFSEKDTERVKAFAIPLFTKHLVTNSDVVMLQHLVNIGAKLNIKGVASMSIFKSNVQLQSIIEEYKDRLEVEKMEKKRKAPDNDKDSVSVLKARLKIK